jgi:hypothetical protein
MSDYNIRGITQSARNPSFAAYVEPRYNIHANQQFYARLSGEHIDFPNCAAAQIDLYSGLRFTIDKLSLDLGLWYYGYPVVKNFRRTDRCGILYNAQCSALQYDERERELLGGLSKDDL